MGRDFQIFGPAMVAVNFGAHIPVVSISGVAALSGLEGTQTRMSDLGLCLDEIHVHLNFKHQDVMSDAYGPSVPIDQQWLLADATITTKLVHWDADIMELCLREACGGSDNPTGDQTAGTLALAGTIMGGGNQAAKFGEEFIPGSGYHYVSLNILPSPSLPGSQPWRFPAAYLTDRPVVMPLGTERSVAVCIWRAIPYGIVPNQEAADISGGAGTITIGPTGSTAGFSITTVVSRPDANAIGTSTEPVILWDHTSDRPFLPGFPS